MIVSRAKSKWYKPKKVKKFTIHKGSSGAHFIVFLIFEKFCWMIRMQPISLLKLFVYPSLGNFTTHITITAHLIQNQEEFLTRGINFIASKARFLQEAY